MGCGPAHRHTADLWRLGRAGVRTGGRPESWHRRHHDGGGHGGLADSLLGRGSVDRNADGGVGGHADRAFACCPHGAIGPVAARLGPWDHAFRLVPVLLPLSPVGRGGRPAPHHHRL